MSSGRRLSARYEEGGGYPFVVFAYAGREVAHGFDSTKPTLFDQGLVYLGPAFEGRVPPITVTVEGRRERLEGFTADPEVLRVVGAFFRALEGGTFSPGQVP